MKIGVIGAGFIGRAVAQLIPLFVLLVIPTSFQRAMKIIGLIRHLRQPLQMVIYGRAVQLT